MGIQNDAGELLLYIYKQKTEGKEIPQTTNIEKETGWERDRIHNALQYLIGKNMIDGKVVKTLGSTKPQFVMIRDLEPTGTDVVENEAEFQRNFNFTINLGVFKYSWGATEK